MAWRHGHANRLNIKRSSRAIVRSMPSTYVRVKRSRLIYNDLGEEVQQFYEVYAGEALVRPAGGTAETYGLGTVENYQLVILIVGDWGLRQADVVTINDGREYEVTFPPVWFESFTELRLTQRSQITQPT